MLLVFGTVAADCEDGWIKRYEARVAATQAEQPHWASPLVMSAPRLDEGFRADFVRRSTAGAQQSWNYGNTKGFQVVPFRRVQLRFSPPPFFTHTNLRVDNGFGDVAFQMKYRIYGSSESHRNAIVTALFGASVPTGKNGNGSCCAILSPTLAAGKGFGKAVFGTSLGGALPVSNAAKLGRQIIWNSAAQYHVAKFLWVQTEINSTFYRGGSNDGKQQTFATPGLIVSRIPLKRSLTLSVGVGEQIALTHFNTYNHAPIFSARMRF